MWGEGKAWIKAGGAIDPRDELLYQDIIGVETVPRLDGKIQLESKKDMAKRGVKSPDWFDALCYSFAQQVGWATNPALLEWMTKR